MGGSNKNEKTGGVFYVSKNKVFCMLFDEEDFFRKRVLRLLLCILYAQYPWKREVKWSHCVACEPKVRSSKICGYSGMEVLKKKKNVL